MASSLQVLCPNGRRQNVQINPNTKLLQILEEVCQRQGFIPPEDYKLVQGAGRKELDLSLSVRYSSLPNNAKLELVKCASTRVEQDVTIALQLDSGQRLQDSFTPSANLWDILLHMENSNRDYKNCLSCVNTSQTPALHPVCIFMREEIIGESALKAMTLKKLGLTSGKAIIRLLHRPVEDKVLSEIANKIEKEKQKQTKLQEMALKKNELRLLDEMERRKSGDTILEVTSECSPMETSENQDLSQFAEIDSNTRVDNSQLIQEVHDESSNTTPDSTSRLHSVSEEKLTAQDNHGLSGRSEQSSAIDNLRSLNIPGVEIFTPSDFHDLTPQEQTIAHRLMEKYLSGMQTNSGNTSTILEQSQEPAMPFADFKFPEETRGKDLTGSTWKSSLENMQPCDREYIVYNTEESLPSAAENSGAIPDEFFEVTQSDVRIMYRDLQNAVRQLEDQPLMTKAMRRAQTEAFFDQYEYIVIRVQFPDRLTLQGLFRPREPVSALYTFVREHLSDPNEKFYLYTSPPKKVLKDKMSSLAACRLAPAALVYCGSESQKDHLLSQKVRSKISHRMKAEAQVSRVLHSALEDTASVSTAAASTSERREASSSQVGGPRVTRRMEQHAFSSTPSTLPSGSQVPKWLKLSKK